ncbi:hypothetical protein Acsp02_50590 [Actinoplanes sp. NBRC 103695]|nr:hypothetical protein Acsp02_50590 [Actinoplanes sp. NBRC 103695]
MVPFGEATKPAAIAFVGIFACGYLLLFAATLRFPRRAGELRGVLLTAGTLAAVGFVVRINAGLGLAWREWTLFTVATAAFLLAAQLGERFPQTARVWWAACGVTALAAVALVAAEGPGGFRSAAQLAGAAPVPVLALGLAGLATAAAARWPEVIRRHRVYQGWGVAMPPLAVFAFTRDQGALALIGLPLLAVLVTLHLAAWRRPLRTLLPVAGAAVASVAAGAALLTTVGGPFVRATRHRDLLGLPVGGTEQTAGWLSRSTLLVISAVLMLQVVALLAGVVRHDPRAEAVPLAAAVTVLLVVQLAGPVAAGCGVPMPASLWTLPLASDGASFLITLAGSGFLIGAGSDVPKT